MSTESTSSVPSPIHPRTTRPIWRFLPIVLGFCLLLTVLLAFNSREVVAAPTTPAESFDFALPYFLTQAGADSILYVFNTENAPNLVTVQFASGQVVTNVVPSLGLWQLNAVDVSPPLPFVTAVFVSGTDPLETMVKTVYNSGKISLYNGIQTDEADTTLYFAPFERDSDGIIVLNTGASAANVVATFYDVTGVSFSCSPDVVAPGATVTADDSCLPAGFLGTAVVSSDQPVVGVLDHFSLSTQEVRVTPGVPGSFVASAIEQYAPRFAQQYTDGDAIWQSDFVVANVGVVSQSVGYAYYDGFGSPVDSGATSNIPAQGLVFESNNLSDGLLVGGVANGSGEFLLVSQLDVSTLDNRTYASYKLTTAPVLFVPYLFNDNDFGSFLTIQSADFSPMSVAVDFYDVAGSLLYTATFPLESYASLTLETNDITGGDSFLGTAVVNLTGQATAVVDVIEKPEPTCFATPDDGATIYNVLQDAIDSAPSGGTVKVAGICNDVDFYDGANASVFHLFRDMNIIGGYDAVDFDWFDSDPSTHPTIIDAQNSGRGGIIDVCTECLRPTAEPQVMQATLVTVTLQNIILDQGDAIGGAGGGLYVGGNVQGYYRQRHCFQ
jgi:hypothetical protein